MVTSIRRAWNLLDRGDKRGIARVLAVSTLAALTSSLMIGSVFPFLTVLADPERIRTTPALNAIYAALGMESDYSFLVLLGVASLSIIIVANLVQIANAWIQSGFSALLNQRLSLKLFGSYLRQPYEFFLDAHTANLATNVLSEAREAVDRLFRPILDICSASLTVLGIVAMLLWVNPTIAITAFLVLGGAYGIAILSSRKLISRFGKIRADNNEERFRVTNEALSGVKDLKLLGCERNYLSRFEAPALKMARSYAVIAAISQTPIYILQMIAFGGMIALCLVILSPEALSEGSGASGLLPVLGVFAFAGQRLMPELSKLFRSVTMIQSAAPVVDRLHADISIGNTAPDLPDASPAPLGLKNAIALKELGYRYPTATRAGIEDISLSIKAGERIGIVGSTGAGKTTLADVLLGLLPPSSGSMVVDGTEIDATNRRAWMQSVGYVPQDIMLIDASIRENIALGMDLSNIDDPRIAQVSRIAQLHNFIDTELSEGYDSVVGERGVKLSGGQRQRIGIARALYHEADFIVFDEATSALDNLTEQEVMAAIDALPGNKTVLMIAHRLSTVQNCDRIIVLDKGRVADCGPWAELIERSPLFRKMALVA